MVHYAKIVMSWRWCVLGLVCCAGCHCGATHPPKTAFFNPYTLLPCQCKVCVPNELCWADPLPRHAFYPMATLVGVLSAERALRREEGHCRTDECRRGRAPIAAKHAGIGPHARGSAAGTAPTQGGNETGSPAVGTASEGGRRAVAKRPGRESSFLARRLRASLRPISPTRRTKSPTTPRSRRRTNTSEVRVISPPPRRQEPVLAQPAARVTELQPDLPSHLLLLRHLF